MDDVCICQCGNSHFIISRCVFSDYDEFKYSGTIIAEDVEIKVYIDNAADSKMKATISKKIEAISRSETVNFSQ